MRIKKREQKRPVIIRVLQVLEKYSDADNLLKQKDIIKYLKEDYDISIERKAVSNNIAVLTGMGFEIVQEKRSGVYLAKRRFSETELRFLIDGILESKHASIKEKEKIIGKLNSLAGINFISHLEDVKNMNLETPSGIFSGEYLEKIELLQHCINNGWRLRMRYLKWNVNKERESTTATRRIISPYKLIVHNQRYYLVGNYPKYDNLVFLRVDKIDDISITKEPIRPVTELIGCENGLDLEGIKTRLPYLFPDRFQPIKLKCKSYIADDIIDWFGIDVPFEKIDDDYFIATVNSSPRAMEHWIMQYCNHVEVLEPLALREKIKENISEMIIKYFSKNTYNYFKRLLDREQRKREDREE